MIFDFQWMGDYFPLSLDQIILPLRKDYNQDMALAVKLHIFYCLLQMAYANAVIHMPTRGGCYSTLPSGMM